MTGKLAVDFGTSNTVVARWDDALGRAEIVHIPEFGRLSQQDRETISVIPSLIHYGEGNIRWIGQQVREKGLYSSRHTFRWMKQYISHRSPLKVKVGDRDISPFTAGQDFLSAVLTFALQQAGEPESEVAFSVPVEAYEHYENWLALVAEQAGVSRYRLIDEPSAAALGYGAQLQPGSAYLIFDFGGGTLHASAVLIEETEQPAHQRCRVLGKAGRTVGGSRIDQWLFSEILERCGLRDSDEDVRQVSTALLVEAERVKEELSFTESAAIQPINTPAGRRIEAAFTRTEFEDLLDRHELITEIHQTLRSALNAAHERGYSDEAIQTVLMVGGSSQIPAVQRAVRQMFGRDKVHFGRPLDAVARGAAAFAAGKDFFDHIQHDYAIRHMGSNGGGYDYRIIVPKGTPYPTGEPVARLQVKPTYDGQVRLGLAIYELGEARSALTAPLELVFDPSGAARVLPVTPQQSQERSLFWMNENSPTFLEADPPGTQGEARFDVEFRVDANKRLTLTAQDNLTGQLIFKDYPVVRLT